MRGITCLAFTEIKPEKWKTTKELKDIRFKYRWEKRRMNNCVRIGPAVIIFVFTNLLYIAVCIWPLLWGNGHERKTLGNKIQNYTVAVKLITKRCEISLLAQWINECVRYARCHPGRKWPSAQQHIVFPFVDDAVCLDTLDIVCRPRLRPTATLCVHFLSFCQAIAFEIYEKIPKRKKHTHKCRRWLNFKPCHAKRNLDLVRRKHSRNETERRCVMWCPLDDSAIVTRYCFDIEYNQNLCRSSFRSHLLPYALHAFMPFMPLRVLIYNCERRNS